MFTIHKFELTISKIQHIVMPKGARIIKVDTQYNVPMIWAMVDTEAIDEEREFQILGTGQPLPLSNGEVKNQKMYIDTFQQNGGEYIWHLFETINRW